MRKLKILVVSWYYAPKVGGVESVSKIIADGLVKDGYDVSVLTSSKNEETGVLDGCKIVRTPLLFGGKEKFEKYFSGLLDAGNFDVVHGHNLSYPFNVGVSISIVDICNEKNIPVIEHAHNAQLKTPEKTRDIIHSDFDKIICVSGFVRERFISLGVSQGKLVTIPNPLSEKIFDWRDIDAGDVLRMRRKMGVSDEVVVFFPTRVVRVSTLEIGEQKQFGTLVDALTIIKKSGLKFKLVFPGMKNAPNASAECIEKGEKLVEDFLCNKGLGEDFFVFENGLQLSDMPLVYAASDIVCMPSLNETFGMVFLEGQAMGKPVVAARSGAASYVIEDGESGFLVSERNAKELADMLDVLILDKEKRVLMGNAGRERVVDKFSSKKIFEKIEDVYSDIVDVGTIKRESGLGV